MPSATVGALRVELSADSAQFKSGLNEASGLAQKFGGVLGVAAGAVAAFGAAAVAAAAVVVAQMRRVANEADEMGKAAQKVGLMSEELSALKYTAGLAGVGFDSLQTSLIRLTKSMSEVAKGGEGDAAKAFQVLGVSVQNTDGTLRTSAEVMGDVAQKFSEYKDGAEKTALAVAIFGKAGADMIPLLNQGRDAIAASNDEAKALGVTMSGGLARDSERLNDNLSRLWSAFQGIWTAIGERVIPIFANWSDALVETVKNLKLFETAGLAAQYVIDKIGESATWVIGRLSGLGSIMEGIANASMKLFSEGLTAAGESLKAGWNNAAAAIQNASDKIDVLRQKAADKAAFGDLGGAFSTFAPAKANAPTIASATTTAGGTTPEQEYDAEKARIEARLVAIREGLLTEEETKYEAYQKDLMLVEEALNAKILAEQDAANLRLQIEKKFQDEKAKIAAAADTKALSDTASFFGSMAKVTESWGKKNNAVAKALGIAQALISTYVGATKAMEFASTAGPVAGFAAYAAVLAKGLASVAAISSVNTSGGGGGRAIGGGGSYSAPAPQSEQSPRNAYISVTGSTFNREQLRDLTDQLGTFFKDGGGRIVFAS